MIKRFALLTLVAVAVWVLSACTGDEAARIKAQGEADALRLQAQTQAEAARQATAANAARAQVELETAQAAKAGVITGQTVAAVGLGLGLAILAVGLSLAAVTYFNKRAGLVFPTASGQFPLVKVWGPGWSGLIDPNRSTGTVIVKTPTKADRLVAQVARLRGRPVELAGPQVDQPTALSEAGILQLAAQATAAGMTVAATRHPGAVRSANMRDVIEGAITQSTVISRPLPPVEDVDESHVDRLLLRSPESDA